MNARLLFVASCLALITSAFTFVIRGDILPELVREFELSQAQGGLILSGAFFGMFFSMLVGAPLCDLLGMKRILLLAFVCHLTGVIGTIFAPHGELAMAVLFTATFIAGCGNGLVEIAINPLAATLYPKEKTHYLNVLHAWWPGGLILGGLLACFIGNGVQWSADEASRWPGLGLGWQARMALVLIPGVIYFLMVLTQQFPATERVASGVSTGEMFAEALRPMFLIWCFCMLLTASTELGPQQWQESVMKRTANVSGTLILVYTSAMMFVLRHFAGPLAHRLSPVGMLTGSALLAGIGLYLLSFADTAVEAFTYATIFGLGIAYFWPTMLGVTAERFPKGGALLLGIMGSVGNLAIAVVLPVMGFTYDRYSVQSVPAEQQAVVVTEKADWALRLLGIAEVKKIDQKAAESLPAEGQAAVASAQATGAAMAFRLVSRLSILLVVIFGAIAIYDAARGGYRAELLLSPQEERELMAGGVQAPVE